ncbi:protein phosphatase CheZ [Fodinicurvata halophila]|uniref:Protein phosphatase CheZ n=1 Tax=Fodinicurvata halophila TaxID=1419723 RepID=A0ABV8UIY7_9PROT
MAAETETNGYEQRLEALVTRYKDINPDDLVSIVEGIINTAQGDLSSVNLKVYGEIEALSRYIHSARQEIASLRPDEITDEHIPAAGEELEAIVGATEQATNTIMESVEAIENEAANLPPETAERITNAVTNVYEACGFQDITGQRITKVIHCLTHIEEKVHALLETFGEPGDRPVRERKPQKTSEEADAALMNGPQSGESAISQDDIDALLASFD